MSAPGRSAPLVADRLRGLTRRLVLFAVAVGAGFLLAALFQGPAAADGMRGGSGAEPQLAIGGLVEPVVRLAEAARPDLDRQRAAGADDRGGRDSDPSSTGAIGGVGTPRAATPAPVSDRSVGVSPVAVPLSRVDTSAAEHERLRQVSPARAVHRPERRGHPPRPPAGPVRQPAVAAPDLPATPGPTGPPAADLLTAPLPHVVDIVRAPVPHVVDVLRAPVPHVVDVLRVVPIRPVLLRLCQVTGAVLAPALDAIVVPAAPPPPAPAARGPALAPTTDPPPPQTTPTPQAPQAPAAESTVTAITAVRAAAVPPPAGPQWMSVVGPAPPGLRASTGHFAARPDPVSGLPGQPVAPADQDAAGADDGSRPAPGLVRPADLQSPVGAGQPGDLVPLLVGSRAPAPIARPG
ncbi:hypothetical protein AB0B85_00890 [Micromonospora sp. NPDC049044]|uniref:hypothetical protein n=1 Tax=Micromonospora sp. NPDC049044 TaxID=3154827 RepID=UPI0033D8D6D5